MAEGSGDPPHLFSFFSLLIPAYEILTGTIIFYMIKPGDKYQLSSVLFFSDRQLSFCSD